MSAGTWNEAATSALTDAGFRAMAQKIHDAFANAGWVQTADTGQINLATVTSAQNSTRGYEIWRMADALQATTPVFVKVEYNQTNNANREMIVFMTIGFSTDGAGTITSQYKTAAFASWGQGGSGAQNVNSYWSGATNRIAIARWVDYSSSTWTFLYSIERTKDSSGNDTADGVVYAWSYQATSTFGVLYYNAAPPQTESRLIALVTNNTTSVYGLKALAARVVPLAGEPLYPIKNLLVGRATDFPDLNQYSIMVDGGAINYIVLTSGLAAPGGIGIIGAGANLGTAVRPLMRYD